MSSRASLLFSNLIGDVVLDPQGPSYLDNFTHWVFQLSVLPARDREAFRKTLADVASDYRDAGQRGLSANLERLSTMALV